MNSVVVFLFLSFCCFHGRRQGPDDVLFRFLVRCWRGNRTSHEAVVSCNPFTPIEFVFYLTDHFFSPPLLLSAGPKKYVRFVACSILLTQRNTCITGGPFWFFFFFFCLLVFSLPPSLKLFPTLPRITCLFSHVFFFFFPPSSLFAFFVFFVVVVAVAVFIVGRRRSGMIDRVWSVSQSLDLRIQPQQQQKRSRCMEID
ncbi:hypothetical protein IWX47DRAFT_671329 [Phyllosticta citricarpa]